ncbi:Integrase [uncultured Clostridium sp.]|nr:Integrase [uncultured Clostridium sp.]
MGKKRANGEGSIFKRKDGRWQATYSLGYDAKGKMQKKVLYGKTQKEAKEKLEEFKKKYLLQHINVDDKITVQDWFYTFMYDYKQRDLKPSSFARYEGIYRMYIKDTELGLTKLSKLNLTILQRYYNSLIESGIPSSRLKSINTHLRPCLEEATRQDYILKNFAKLVNIPKHSKEKKLEILTVDQQNRFVEFIKGHILEGVLLMALTTGLRQGELLGLHWSDIDFENSTVTVQRSLKRVPIIDRDGNKVYEVREQAPKTNNAYRVVPIPPNTLSLLKKIKIKQNEDKLKAGGYYIDNEYVFCDALGVNIDSKRPNRNLKSVLKKLDIEPIKFHGLRKTYCTRLIESGVDIKTVSELMGHANITITLEIYNQVTQDKKDEAAKKISEIFAQ